MSNKGKVIYKLRSSSIKSKAIYKLSYLMNATIDILYLDIMINIYLDPIFFIWLDYKIKFKLHTE